MIQKSDARNGKGRLVSYDSDSNHRPWLKNAKKIEVTGAVSDFSDSVQVRFFNSSGGSDVAWVGTSFLSWKETSVYAPALESLRTRKVELETELAEVTKAIAVLEKL